MTFGRTNRLLSALGGAATSRVLNLATIACANAGNHEYQKRPLFSSPMINSAILLKHRLRSDETYMFNDARLVATKIIVPFDIRDLRAGGRSVFIDQRGFRDTLRSVGNYCDDKIERDMAVLRIVNTLPSLDPFLLREHLRSHQIDCADCYFEISLADQQRMHDYVAGEVRKLIYLATGGGKGNHQSTTRLVTAMLSSGGDDKLEPLRQTLMMNGSEFHEGVFSWRGFLYYKWCMDKFWPEVISVLRDIKAVRPVGAMDRTRRTFLLNSQRNIISKVLDGSQLVRKLLGVYDAAYDDLVAQQAPKTFRDFLLSAPHLFLELGDTMGAISHIVSFWRYRFPDKKRLTIDAEELTTIFQDFNSSFSGSVATNPPQLPS